MPPERPALLSYTYVSVTYGSVGSATTLGGFPAGSAESGLWITRVLLPRSDEIGHTAHMDKNTSSNDDALRTRAIALREAGWSNLKIRAELGLTGWKLTQLFQGHVEPVHANLANRAKTELREQARGLRLQGWGYPAIARKLRVSKSSLSLWLRDLPKPEKHHPGEPPLGSGMTPRGVGGLLRSAPRGLPAAQGGRAQAGTGVGSR